MAEKIELSPLRLAGGILVSPGFVQFKQSNSKLERPESPFLTLDMADKFPSLTLPLGSNKDHPVTCPIGAAAPPIDGLDLPSFLLCVAEMDLIWDTEIEYYAAMKKVESIDYLTVSIS